MLPSRLRHSVFVALVFVLLFVAGPSYAITCGWSPVEATYCSSPLSLTGQNGYITGEDFIARTRITDSSTRSSARNLPSGAANIFVDKHGACRYLGNSGGPEYFVPFNSAREWVQYLDNQPGGASAVACAREKGDSLDSVCGSTSFSWQRGKQGDTQTANFQFTRARAWTLMVPATYSCNCQTYIVSYDRTKRPPQPIYQTYCDTCEYCRDSGQRSTTSCTVNLSWSAPAVGNGAARPSAQTAEWAPAAPPTGDCSPAAPDTNTGPPQQQPLATDGTCGPASGQTFASAPAAGLCSRGSAAGVSGAGPWNWSCAGENGGNTAYCSANVVAGICTPDRTLLAAQTTISTFEVGRDPIATNCIDAPNPRFEDNIPEGNPQGSTDRTTRFMNTCGNRYCISQGFMGGRIIEYFNQLARLECRRDPANAPECSESLLQRVPAIDHINTTVTAVSENCIDLPNPLLSDNLPTDSFKIVRFVNTCGNRYCRVEGYTSGRVIEFMNDDATLECSRDQAANSEDSFVARPVATVTGIAQHCIDPPNPTLADNMPDTALKAMRFVNTCGNRYCIGMGYVRGRVIEHMNDRAELECWKY